jgi:hypothetical protein
MNIFSFIVVAITIDPANKTAADSLLPIIQSQRERYRIRAQELEAVSLIRPIIHMYYDCFFCFNSTVSYI